MKDFRENDLIQLSLGDDEAVVLVSSKMGIGTTTLELKEGKWPSKIVVKLKLSTGEPFKALEGFFAVTSEFGTTSSLGNPGKPAYYKLNDAGFIDESARVGDIDLVIRKLKDCIEVTIPMDVLGPKSGFLKLRWIDFYRG